MKILNKEEIMSQNPTELHSIRNRYAQQVVFYEHPIYGDEHTVLGIIGDTVFDTGFWDCGDFYSDLYKDSDYNPILYNGGVYCTYQIDNDFIEKGIFDKELLGKI